MTNVRGGSNIPMSITRRILTVVLFAALAGAAAAAPPSRKDVLVAISVLEKNITSPEASDAAKTIVVYAQESDDDGLGRVVVYAQESDDVMVDIGRDQLPWVAETWGLDKETEQADQSLLLAAFVPGNRS